LELLHKIKLPLAVGIIMLFISQVLGPVSANELDRLRREQETLSRQIKQQEQQLKQNQQQIRNVTSDINQLERDIERVQREINVLKKRLADTEKRVEEVEAELADAEERLAIRTGVLAARVKEIFINGQINYLEILLQSSSINDLLTRMVLLEKLMEQDIVLLEEIEAERYAIEVKKASLEIKRTEINSIKLDTERKERDLLAKTRQRQNWLASLETNAEALEKALDQLEEDSKKIEKMIQEELAKRGSGGQGIVGKAAWPTPGYTRISSDYGMRRHPILRAQRMHTGIDIAAPMYINAVAAEFGRVMYADWLGGYGKTIIIDHGKSTSTLYAHLNTISVNVGDQVTRGQVIGKVGSTGQSTGPHLHFEVRINGSHINPWPYLR
jgi:murein DD-endopeptidase MepM/ murein hydrolase activator NlpD